MSYKNLTSLGLGTALLLSCASLHALEGTCPTLDLKTLPVAACATDKNVYKSGSLAKVSYIAKTPCPSQIGLKKLLQSVFKGAKEYPGTVISTKPGSFTCTYKLNEEWKKALNTTDNELHLDGTLPTAKHVNYLNVPMVGFSCPALQKNMFNEIKGKQKIQLPSTKDPSFIYTLTPRPLTIDSHAQHLFTKVFETNISNLPALSSAKAKITKDFEITCLYEHKTGGEKQELILAGSSKGNS